MNPDQIKESIQAVVDGLTPLAQKLQVPIEGLFGWAIKHNYAEAVMGLLPLALLLGAILPIFLKNIHKADWNAVEVTPHHVIAIISGLFAGLFTIVAMLETGEAIARLVAPEWYTIQDIVGLLK